MTPNTAGPNCAPVSDTVLLVLRHVFPGCITTSFLCELRPISAGQVGCPSHARATPPTTHTKLYQPLKVESAIKKLFQDDSPGPSATRLLASQISMWPLESGRRGVSAQSHTQNEVYAVSQAVVTEEHAAVIGCPVGRCVDNHSVVE